MERRTIRLSDIKIGERHRSKLGNLEALKQSIEERGGLIEPIILTPGKELISGRRRIAAYRALGRDEIECDYFDIDSIVHGERDENVCREDLSPSDMVAIAEAVEAREKELAKERQVKAGEHGKKGAEYGKEGGRGKKKPPGGKLPTGGKGKKSKKEVSRSKTRAAKAVGTTRKTLTKAQAVVAAAKENPEYADLVTEMDKSGKVSAAHKELERREAAKEALERADKIRNPDILMGDFREVGSQIEDGSVSLIFTDPPYSKENIGLYGDLGSFGVRVLKEGGSLLTFAGQYAIPEIIALMEGHLRYWWILCCKHEGQSARLFGWHVRVSWKPILWFVKGKLPSEYPMVSDFVLSKKPDKTGHKWAQSLEEAKYYINLLTYKEETVCDPFLGSGTTCIAAKLLGRRYIGIEEDQGAADVAKVRIDDA